MRIHPDWICRFFRLCLGTGILFAVVGRSVAPNPVWAGELTLLTEDNPPLNFDLNGKATGLAPDVVEQIQKRLGTDNTVEVIPWARAYEMVLKGPRTGLFVTNRTPEREKLFKWVGPISHSDTSFYSLKTPNINISKIDDARLIESIAVPRDDFSDQYLTASGFTNLNRLLNIDMAMRMLIAGRAQLVVTENYKIPTLARHNDVFPDDFQHQFTISHSVAYIAFSKDTPNEIIDKWQSTLNEMKKEGIFGQIYQKWLPKESPPE